MLVGGFQFIKNRQELFNTLLQKNIHAQVYKNDKNQIILTFTGNEIFVRTLFNAKLIDKNTLVLTVNTTERGEFTRKDPKLEFLNNLTLKRQYTSVH
ncbi:hypothetical protein ACFQ3S_08725 [Mucilaginibacter terrae]|uniref:hypothetical protein n=1 Tax=Mucilaginibacter terrae TaxID=1955052 RepID=UPI00362B3976